MESLTYYKNQRITPRKYREVVSMVRGKKPVEAINELDKINKKAAMSLSKILKSAITNATSTMKVSDDMLQFKLFTVEEGNKLKRYRAASRGMAKAFIRRMSHIKIILKTEDVVKAQPAPVKTEKKVEKVETKKESVKKSESKKAPAKKAESKKVEKVEEKAK